jgi:hypothetical protein
MKITRFDPPGNIDDFGTDDALKARWSAEMSRNFDVGVASVTRFLNTQGGGTCQFYNPVTQGRTDPDLPLAAGDIPWNGFPKRFLSTGPGQPTQFQAAEPVLAPGENRPQDEYLEWHVTRNAAGKIVSVQFTCEGYDYYEFLGEHAPDKLLELYRQFISPSVQRSDLFNGDTYDRLNRFNTSDGAMHLTHSANNLFAEVFLAASATVRRRNTAGNEITQPIPLIRCGRFGGVDRNSDPTIGAGVNGFARARRMITLANPVGLYIANFDGSGFHLSDGTPAGQFFRVLRGTLPRALRAEYRLSPELEAQGLTVSDVFIGGNPITFGGQIAQRITMKLTGVASVAQTVNNTPTGCGAVSAVEVGGGGLGLTAVGQELPPLRSVE